MSTSSRNRRRMRIADLEIGECYKVGYWQGPAKLIAIVIEERHQGWGRSARTLKVRVPRVEVGGQVRNVEARDFKMPWSEWEAQQAATAASAERQRAARDHLEGALIRAGVSVRVSNGWGATEGVSLSLTRDQAHRLADLLDEQARARHDRRSQS